jgi:hypothetical protein
VEWWTAGQSSLSLALFFCTTNQSDIETELSRKQAMRIDAAPFYSSQIRVVNTLVTHFLVVKENLTHTHLYDSTADPVYGFAEQYK